MKGFIAGYLLRTFFNRRGKLIKSYPFQVPEILCLNGIANIIGNKKSEALAPDF